MARARVKVTEKELRDLTVEHELLLQAFEKVNYHLISFTFIRPGSCSCVQYTLLSGRFSRSVMSC